MRGQIFTLDAVMAVFLLSASLYVISTTIFDVVSFTSRDLLLRRWENVANYAVQTLLLADGDWACKVEDIRVPGCVISKPYTPQKARFFPVDVKCYLEGDSNIQSLMGCKDIPSNPLMSYTVDFKACVGDPGDCTVKTLRLTIWKGQ